MRPSGHGPRYYIRLDDAHPAMNAGPWTEVEALLDKHGIRPIVAVIPDNRDQGLCHGAPDTGFWDRVRRWQARGWHIGVHGLTHELRAGAGGLLRINTYGEMAGLPEAEQLEKLRRAIHIFSAHDIRAQAFIAPAHSFDRATLRALAAVGIGIVSDGFETRPYLLDGLLFIPQQLWRPRVMSFGTWTICLHPSGMKSGDFQALDLFLEGNRNRCPPELPSMTGEGWSAQRLPVAGLLKTLFWMKKAARSAANATRTLV